MPQRDTLRASDDDREQVAERLRQATAEGRLLAEELEHRLGAAFKAKTYGELDQVVADLPGKRVARRSSMPAGRPVMVAAIVVAVAAAVALAAVVIAGLFAFGGLWVFVAWWIFGSRKPHGHHHDHGHHHHSHHHHVHRGQRFPVDRVSGPAEPRAGL